MCHFKGRKDETKLIPHLKAFHTEMNKLFAEHALYSISLDFEKNEIYQIYLYFGRTSRRFIEFKLSMEFLKSNIEILEVSKNYLFIARTYTRNSVYYIQIWVNSQKQKVISTSHWKSN